MKITKQLLISAFTLPLALLTTQLALATTFQVGACHRTKILTPVVTVCEAKLDQADAFAIVDISGKMEIYKVTQSYVVGDDSTFGTTKVQADLSLAGEWKSDTLIPPATPATAHIWSGYKTGTQELVYLQGSREIDFLIDLRN